MITLDEAISKQREIAETQRLLYEACILKEQNTHFLRQAEEHEQLAEWLEELKAYRECNVCEYNKAIDDLSNILKENYDYLPQILSQEAFDGYIDEHAEQLKAGGENV